LQAPSTPPPGDQTAPPAVEASASPTATISANVPLEYGATELAYGEKRGSYPRKSEGTTFGFQGAQGDVITIVLASSNARPQDSRCKDWVASTNFTLSLPSGEVPATVESAHLSSLRDYKLPAEADAMATARRRIYHWKRNSEAGAAVVLPWRPS
jgi:hypothetical protein